MRILFFLHDSFFGSDRLSELGWIDSFANAVSASGHEVTRFDSLCHRITDFEIIHVFSSSDPETWSVMKNTGTRVVVTPALSAPSNESKPFLSIVVRLIRSGYQRRWPPIDQDFFWKVPDRYFVISTKWKSFLEKTKGVSAAKTIVLSADPQKAAHEACRAYETA